MSDKNNLQRRIIICIFTIYILFLLFVIVLKYPTGLVKGTIDIWLDGGDIKRLPPQLIPFKTIIFYVSHVQAVYDWFFKNLACNIVMFIPYGFLLPLISKRKVYSGWKVVVSGCLFSTIIEIFQYITAFGVCDIDDVILNTMGVMLGLAAYTALKRIKSKGSKV